MATNPKNKNGRKKADSDVVAEEIVEDAVVVEEESTPKAEEPEAAPVDEIPQDEPETTGSNFVPLLVGGIVAGAIGFGAAYLMRPADSSDEIARLQTLLENQNTAIGQLRDQASALEAAQAEKAETLQLQEAQTALASQIQDSAEAATVEFGSLSQRLDEVEKRPGFDGTLADSAIAAYERELAQLQADVAAQREEMQAMVDATSATLSETKETAAEYEQNAQAAAEFATRRAALAKIEAAIQSGAPFASELAEFGDVNETPAALTAAAEFGVATSTQLIESFDQAARLALATARQEGVAGEDGGGFSAFIRSQFEVRSVEAVEGDNADAILSRAQAAIEAGHISDAIAEVQTLPEVARAEMTDWLGAAESRLAAVAAVETLAHTLNQN